MPGFSIGGQGEGPSNTTELFRQHRWSIVQLGPFPARPSDGIFIAESLQLPNVSIQEQIIQGGLIAYKFAKGVKWEDVTVTFYDTDGLLEQLEDWRSFVYTNEDGIGNHFTYKGDSTFELLDGEGMPKVTLTLKNSWPKAIAHGPLSYSSSDIKIISLTLSYDFAETE